MNDFAGSRGWKAAWGIPRPGPEMPMIRLTAGQSIDCVILSTALWAVTTHWNGSHSEPCYGMTSGCAGCKSAHPKRWKGYLHIHVHENSNQAFLEFTPTSATALMQLAPENEPLRGLKITVKRREKADNGRLSLSVWGARVESAALPKEKDPHQVLAALWGIENIPCQRLETAVN